MLKNGTIQWRTPGKEKTLSLAIAGDVCPRNEAEQYIRDGHAKDILADILPYLDRADLRLVQWETPLCEKEAPISKCGPNLRVHPECVDFLKAGHFEIALLANNHTGDQDAQGTLSTLSVLDANHIRTVGAGKDLASARRPLRLEKNGLKLSIINVAEGEFGLARKDYPGANPLDTLDTLADIRQEKASNDLVLVVIHGGNEYNPIPSPRMKQTYRAFADAGASAIVNIHPHCPQGMEIYHDVPIIYSPGNFFFPWREDGNYDASKFWFSGYLPRISFDQQGAYALEITPYYFSDLPAWKIHPLKGKQRQWFLDYLDKITTIFHQEGEHFYDLWCAYRYQTPLWWLKNFPKDELVERYMEPEIVHRTPPVRHMMTCQSHAHLTANILLLIEQFKLQELRQETHRIEELQVARYAEQPE